MANRTLLTKIVSHYRLVRPLISVNYYRDEVSFDVPGGVEDELGQSDGLVLKLDIH